MGVAVDLFDPQVNLPKAKGEMDPEYEKRLLRQHNGQMSPFGSVSVNFFDLDLEKKNT